MNYTSDVSSLPSRIELMETDRKPNRFIDYKIGTLVRNKDDKFEILQDLDNDFLYRSYRIQTSVILRDTETKKCLTCERLFESMVRESEKWFVVDHLKFYCGQCGVPTIEFTHFKERKMPRLMNDIYKEVKEHPNYDDLTMLTKLEISHYSDPSSKRSSYDNKVLKNIWLFLHHNITVNK